MDSNAVDLVSDVSEPIQYMVVQLWEASNSADGCFHGITDTVICSDAHAWHASKLWSRAVNWPMGLHKGFWVIAPSSSNCAEPHLIHTCIRMQTQTITH
jgi:hypothetical protein